ncbi:ABC transporter ATP-binding protein [Kribbella catacumbae]|uniref:ABC transporter ATP-binding protein n=1 Tax=Kribbella catacumbae TaxID=460086 RepID=UPI000379642D|nr:ABC transporter ATP-binding protein [Kribbella catacumbae]
MSLLSVRDLEVGFDAPAGEVRAVRSVSFDLAPGERVALVGESGCGKTTTMLAMMGLLPAGAVVSGQVLLDGRDILAGGESSMRPHRWTDIAMVFQGAMNALNPVRRVGAQIVEAVRIHGGSRRDGRSRTRELLELVGLPADFAARYPHELSGGQRQRAVIALALACEPRVLLADEPTTALDVIVQDQIVTLLRELSDTLGLAVVMVTHDLALVPHLCERAAVMYAGSIVETAACADIVQRPAHPYTRRLVDATPDLAGLRPLSSIPGVPPRLDQVLSGCPFQPRCTDAVESCETTAPPLLDLGAGRSCACHLTEVVA